MTGIRPDHHRPSNRCHSYTVDSRVGEKVVVAETRLPVPPRTGPTTDDDEPEAMA